MLRSSDRSHAGDDARTDKDWRVAARKTGVAIVRDGLVGCVARVWLGLAGMLMILPVPRRQRRSGAA